MAISSAPKISNSRNTGVTSGGRANIPSNSTKFRIMLKRVTVRIPIIIAPGIFLIESIAISKNPKPANKVLEFAKSPKLRKVAPSEIIIPPFFRPINPIKRPTPAPIAILRFSGILSSIHLRKGVMLIMKKRTPAMKTAPRAVSQA